MFSIQVQMCQVSFSAMLAWSGSSSSESSASECTDPERVIRAHRVCRDRVLGLAVAVSPKVGLQLDLKPVQAREIGPLANSVSWKC